MPHPALRKRAGLRGVNLLMMQPANSPIDELLGGADMGQDCQNRRARAHPGMLASTRMSAVPSEFFIVLFCQMPKSSVFMMSYAAGSGPFSPPNAMPLGASGILCDASSSGPTS